MRLAHALGNDVRRQIRAHDFLARPAENALRGGIPCGDFPVRIHEQDRIERGVEDGPGLRLAGKLRALAGAFFRHVMEDEDDPAQCPAFGENRGCGIFDRNLATAARAQHGVIREPDDDALAQHALDGIFGRRSGLLVENGEHLGESAPARFGGAPAGQPLGRGIEQDDHPRGVRGNHGVADGVQRHLQFARALLGSGEARPVRTRHRAPQPAEPDAEHRNDRDRAKAEQREQPHDDVPEPAITNRAQANFFADHAGNSGTRRIHERFATQIVFRVANVRGAGALQSQGAFGKATPPRNVFPRRNGQGTLRRIVRHQLAQGGKLFFHAGRSLAVGLQEAFIAR